MGSLLPDEVVAELDERFAHRFRALPEAKRSALVAAAAEGQVTNGRLQQVLDLHPRDLTHMLGDLVREGFLVPHGERAGRWYTLGSDQSALSSDQRSEQSSDQRSEQTSRTADQSGASKSEQCAELVRGGRWARREQVADILRLCADEIVDPPTLAAALGRAASTIRAQVAEPEPAAALVCDLSTNQHFTLKINPMRAADLEEFVALHKSGTRQERTATWSESTPEGRWRSYTYDELDKRDKCSLDQFWLKDDSLLDTESLPDPDVIAAEIAEDLRSALEQIEATLAELDPRG